MRLGQPELYINQSLLKNSNVPKKSAFTVVAEM